MISFRYHIVTIVAVFLALAIGLLAGSAFVQPGLVSTLQRQTDDLREQTRVLREQVSEAHADSARLEAFIDAALPYLARDRLLGTAVVIVTQEGVEDAVLAGARDALSIGGARVLATLSVRSDIMSEDPDVQAALGELLGRPDAAPEELPGLAAQALAERLAPGGQREDGLGGDLMRSLLSAGFIAPVGAELSDATVTEIGGDGQVVVVLGGGLGEEPAIPPEAFAIPLVRSLATLGVPVAAAEPVETDFPFVELLRAEDDPSTVTVDDLDRSMGGAALVLGIRELLATGRGGAYGVKDGATPLPPLP